MARRNNAARKIESQPMALVPSEVLVEGLAELSAKHTELKAKRRLLMEVEQRNAWEAATKAVNPGYKMGSIRTATEADRAILGHTHGQVCVIVCLTCGEERLVNKQDAKQTQYCKSCKRGASSARNQARRQAKKLAGTSREDLEQQIAALDAQLAKLS